MDLLSSDVAGSIDEMSGALDTVRVKGLLNLIWAVHDGSQLVTGGYLNSLKVY